MRTEINARELLKLVRLLGRNSLLRSLQYMRLEGLRECGRVLDYGGGEGSRYKHLIKCSRYESVNIDKDISPTRVLKVGEKIPYDDGSFDTVLCINTLEHVYDAYQLIVDLSRTTVKGGHIVIATPFMFKMHGCPYDYGRYTVDWYTETARRLGLEAITIETMRWGPLSCLLEDILNFSWIKVQLLRILVILEAFIYRGYSLFKKKDHNRSGYVANAIGMWVVYKKV